MAIESDLAPATDLGDGILQIRLPMAGNPLRYINGYLLDDDDGATLVDCGWRAPDVEAALHAALAAHGTRLADVRRLAITHHHYDHYGLAGTLLRAGVGELHMHPLDWERAQRYAIGRAAVDARSEAWLRRNGFVAPVEAADEGARIADRSELTPPTHLAEDGARIGRLTALWTPGHAPGHLCFADERTGRILTGDHVLDPITPHVGIWLEGSDDPLGAYLDSLERIAAFGTATALPAHGEPFADVGRRARAIVAHTRIRDGLILAAASAGAATAGDVARGIPWTGRERSFETLSALHQEFAVTETIAHLEHLFRRGLIDRESAGEVIRYVRSA